MTKTLAARTGLLSVLVAGLVSGFRAALAVEASCDGLAFEPAIIERFPSVAQSCHSVVERNGRPYVRLVADVIRVHDDDSVTIALKAPDGERFRQEFRPPPGFRALISGKPTPVRGLRRGQEIRIYLPERHWQVIESTD